MQVTFNIKDSLAQEVEDAIAALGGYKDTLEDGTPNPETKNAFVRKQYKNWAKNQLMEYRNRTALATVAASDGDL